MSRWADLDPNNLELPPWLLPAAERLALAPDADSARALARDVLVAVGREALEQRAELAERLASRLWALCAVAPFFAPMLRRTPSWLLSLVDDSLERPRAREALTESLEAALARDPDAPSAVLRRFKYYELARITVRDCDESLVPLALSGRTLTELSQLADVLLARALQVARDATSARFGPPRWRGASGRDFELSTTVLGLGKLGSEELNYSSDVDLIYVFEAPPEDIDFAALGGGYAELSPIDYFTRLGQRLSALVSEATVEGFLYRVDLDLRPEGNLGPLVVTEEALERYYEVRAETWEKASFMKARPVAGDLAFGWRVIRMVDPMIYRSTMDYAAVEGIAGLKKKIEAARERGREGFDVKTGPGGIRDVEFIAQAMQLLHGGRIEQVRARGTQDALERLRDVHLLPDAQVAQLLHGYLFLRRVENRLQMEREGQVHRLSTTPEGLTRVAKAMRLTSEDGTGWFSEALSLHRGRVLEVFQGFFFEAGEQRIFDLLARHVPGLLATGGSRRLLEELALQFANAVDAGSDPERALNNLDRFVDAVAAGRFYLELLFDRPELVPRLAALFASSNYLSAILTTHPRLIEPVFHDPNQLLLDRAELEADFERILAECTSAQEDDEGALDALRLFFYRQILNVGLLDLAHSIARQEGERALTEIAEVCLGRALGSAREWLHSRRPELAELAACTRFVVIGMGKLASRELSYGSDLDLIFIFDVVDAQGRVADDPLLAMEAQEYATRLAQRMISILQTNTAQGTCYEVDARLRPSGNQGTLVSSLPAFERYHETRADTWERQILLRARVVAGDSQLADAFESLRLAILRRPLPGDARAHIHHVRQRMERELALETSSRRDFKRGRGGLLDVENIVQVLQLEHGAEHPELLQPETIETLLPRLSELGLLAPERAASLLESWDFLQALSSRLRIVENRSISDLDDERGDLESLARALGYGTEAERDARRLLLVDYERHTETTRAIYRAFFPAG